MATHLKFHIVIAMGKLAKNLIWSKLFTGVSYWPKNNASELHFARSFQGHPTWQYLAHPNMHSGKGSDWANTKWFERTKTSAFGANSPERWFCDADPSSRSNTQRECPSEGFFCSSILKPIKNRPASTWCEGQVNDGERSKDDPWWNLKWKTKADNVNHLQSVRQGRTFPSHKRSHWV